MTYKAVVAAGSLARQELAVLRDVARAKANEEEDDIIDGPWTPCEVCAHACGDDDDYIECGPGHGNPCGGGVTFDCKHFEPNMAMFTDIGAA